MKGPNSDKHWAHWLLRMGHRQPDRTNASPKVIEDGGGCGAGGTTVFGKGVTILEVGAGAGKGGGKWVMFNRKSRSLSTKNLPLLNLAKTP